MGVVVEVGVGGGGGGKCECCGWAASPRDGLTRSISKCMVFTCPDV
jgi:hypothetical protein